MMLSERSSYGPQHTHGPRCVEKLLLNAAQQGDELAVVELMRRYRSLVRGRARSYFLAGADRDDVIQEGMVGLFKAIRDYDPTRESGFRSFAELCVTRQIISAVKSATRQKHHALNGAVSLSAPTAAQDGEQLLSDIVAARGVCDPAQLVLAAWESDFITTGMVDMLSSFEHDVLRMYVAGRSYVQIADSLGRSPKAVDNALQRIRRKMAIQIERCHSC